MFYVITQPLPSNILYVFYENFVFKGKMFRKYIILKIFDFFVIFKISKIRDSSFVALLIIRHIL